MSTSVYVVDIAYTFSPLIIAGNVSAAVCHVPRGAESLTPGQSKPKDGMDVLEYTLHIGGDDEAGATFCVDPRTGVVTGSYLLPGKYSMSLSLVNGFGQSGLIEEWVANVVTTDALTNDPSAASKSAGKAAGVLFK